MTEELKPCPCCGSPARAAVPTAFSGDWFCWVVCPSCGLRTDRFVSAEEAAAAWNTRAERECENLSGFQACDCLTCSGCGESFSIRRYDYDDAYYSLDYAITAQGAYECDCEVRYCPNCGAKVVE